MRTLPVAAVATLFGTSSGLADGDVGTLSTAAEQMFEHTSTQTDRGKLFYTLSSLDATTAPCTLVFFEATTIDGASFVEHTHTVDAARINIGALREVPSFMRDTDPELLEPMVWLTPTQGSFIQETERFGDHRELLYGSGGTCDETSCREGMETLMHVVAANDGDGHKMIGDLAKACGAP